MAASSARKRIGPYRVIGELGKGGMGVVHHAVHEPLQRAVAIKELLAKTTEDKEAIELWLQCAQMTMPPGPGMDAPVSLDDLPNIKKLFEDYMKNLGRDHTFIGKSDTKQSPEEKAQDQANQQMQAQHQPINPPPQPSPV